MDLMLDRVLVLVSSGLLEFVIFAAAKAGPIAFAI